MTLADWPKMSTDDCQGGFPPRSSAVQHKRELYNLFINHLFSHDTNLSTARKSQFCDTVIRFYNDLKEIISEQPNPKYSNLSDHPFFSKIYDSFNHAGADESYIQK